MTQQRSLRLVTNLTTILLLPLVFLFCCQFSCGTGKTIDTLETVVTLAGIAVDSLSGTLIDPKVAASIDVYLSDVLDLAPRINDIANTVDTDANKAARITSLIAAAIAAAPSLPQGTPVVIVNTIKAVADALIRLQAAHAVSPVPTASIVNRSDSSNMQAAFADTKQPAAGSHHKLTKKQQNKLNQVTEKARAAKAKLKALKK